MPQTSQTNVHISQTTSHHGLKSLLKNLYNVNLLISSILSKKQISWKLVQNMFNFLVLSEIAEEELAELSQYSNGDPEMEKAQAEARRDRRRTKITQEMFETEKTYLNHLELVNKVSYYEQRMMQMIEKNPMISDV